MERSRADRIPLFDTAKFILVRVTDASPKHGINPSTERVHRIVSLNRPVADTSNIIRYFHRTIEYQRLMTEIISTEVNAKCLEARA